RQRLACLEVKGPKAIGSRLQVCLSEKGAEAERERMFSRAIGGKGPYRAMRRKSMRFAEQMEKLTEEQRLSFYEALAHNLTVSIRGVWSDATINDAEKVDRIKWINEVLHRVTAKIRVLRLKTHEWTEADFGEMMRGWASHNEAVKAELFEAVNRSYRAVTGEEIG